MPLTRQLEAFAWHSTSDSLYRRRLARTRRRGPPWRQPLRLLSTRGAVRTLYPPTFRGRNPPSMLPFRSCVNAAASLGTPAGTPRAAGSTGSRSPNPETPPASSMSRGCVTMSMPRLVGRGRSFGHGPDIGEWLAAPSAGNCRAGPVRRRVLPHSRPPCLTADLKRESSVAQPVTGRSRDILF